MKNIIVTVIVGFITGLVISGILFDVIKYVGKSFNRVSVSWNISKAEKAYSNGRFSDSVLIYKKTLPKIDFDNKTLIAKTKNNLALSLYKNYLTTNNNEELNEALTLFKEAETIYMEIGNNELAEQTAKNILVATPQP
ncbi:hypothetical protein [Candidatus Ruminimicrobiellum ovillum]|uniref:hypothetical protein n=1 Tax=Candidatus Ruminimicrobiellum ovillum TaxID=1947927 RepID=UPI00355A33DC